MKKLYAVAILLFTCLTIYIIYVKLYVRFDLGGDAGYYLQNARLFAEGLKPYKDFAFGYTYISLFAYRIPLYFSFIPPVLAGLLVQLFINLINCIILYVISRRIGLDKLPGIFISFFFFLVSVYYFSFIILLEPIINMFALLSAYFFLFAQKQKYFGYGILAGFFAVMAFFTKQYGIISVFMIGFGSIVYWGIICNKWMGVIGAVLGGILGLLVNILIIVFYFDVSIAQFISQISGSGYGSRSLFQLLTRTLMTLQETGGLIALILLVTYLFIDKSIRSDKSSWGIYLFLIPLTLLYFLPFYVQPYDHYFLLSAPFVALLFAYSLMLYKRIRQVEYALFFCLFFIGIGFGTSYIYKISFWEPGDYTERGIIAKELAGNKKVFIYDGYVELYFLSDLRPAMMKKYGYAYSNGLNDNALSEIISQAEVIITRQGEGEKLIKKYDINYSDTITRLNTTFIIK